MEVSTIGSSTDALLLCTDVDLGNYRVLMIDIWNLVIEETIDLYLKFVSMKIK